MAAIVSLQGVYKFFGKGSNKLAVLREVEFVWVMGASSGALGLELRLDSSALIGAHRSAPLTGEQMRGDD